MKGSEKKEEERGGKGRRAGTYPVVVLGVSRPFVGFPERMRRVIGGSVADLGDGEGAWSAGKDEGRVGEGRKRTHVELRVPFTVDPSSLLPSLVHDDSAVGFENKEDSVRKGRKGNSSEPR